MYWGHLILDKQGMSYPQRGQQPAICAIKMNTEYIDTGRPRGVRNASNILVMPGPCLPLISQSS